VALEARLDKNAYDESSLIEIKVPLYIPYQTDFREFQRCDGEIVLKGVHYKYVKRKVQDGVLILKCIRNESQSRIASARNELFSFFNDLQQNNSCTKKQATPHSPNLKNTLGDFDNEQFFDISFSNFLSSITNNAQQSSIKICLLHSTPEQPPEACIFN